MRRAYHAIRVDLAALAAVAIVVSGCAVPDPDRRQESQRQIHFFAAASTMDAVEQLQPLFRQHGMELVPSFAGSSTLARQIAHGARAELFLSADSSWVDFLDDRELVARRTPLLSNRLVLVTPCGSTLASQEQLTSPNVRRLALADPHAVPSGRYAKMALENSSLWNRVESKVVATKDVRQALYFVETGNADAGFVYMTDARRSTVRVASEVDPKLTGPIRYSLAQISGTQDPSLARKAFELIESAEAMELFRRHGFGSPVADGASHRFDEPVEQSGSSGC